MNGLIVRITTLVLLVGVQISCGDVGIHEPFQDDGSIAGVAGHSPAERPSPAGATDGDPGADQNRGENPGEAQSDPGFPPLQGVAQFTEPLRPEPEIVTEIIGPSGGAVRLGDFEIVVPAGAVVRNTLFSIRRPADRRTRAYVVAELQPHNVEFEVPVIVRMPVEGTNGEGAEVAVSRWSGREWGSLDTYPIESGARIEARTRTLSFWSARFRGGELISGGS